jgi:hypothetical protein
MYPADTDVEEAWRLYYTTMGGRLTVSEQEAQTSLSLGVSMVAVADPHKGIIIGE